MKKTLITIAALAAGLQGQAQFKMGPEVGFNISTIVAGGTTPTPSTSNISLSNLGSLFGALSSFQNKYSFRAGLQFEYAFSEVFAVQADVLYSSQGATLSATSVNASVVNLSVGEGSTTLNYVKVPIDAVYKVDAGIGKFFIGAGPYVAYAMTGTATSGSVNASIDTGSTKIPIILPSISTAQKFGSDSGAYKALDFGVNLMAGLELSNGLTVKAGYDYGLQSFSNIPGYTLNNSCFYISVGMYLSNSKKERNR